ncbi:hypothetical protein D3C78_1267030 [compost metagenome]
MHRLAPFGAGDANHRALRYGRVTGNGRLDFGGVDVLTTTDHHVLQTVANVDKALAVHVATVTGVHPAATQRLGSGFGFVPVTKHHVRAAHSDLSDSSPRQLLILGVNNAHFHTDTRQASGEHLAIGLMFGVVMFWREGCGDWGQFGHAIALGKTGTGEQCARTLKQRRGNR